MELTPCLRARRIRLLVSIALASGLGVGCASQPPTLDQCLEMHAAGDFAMAAKSVAKVRVGDDPCAWFLLQRGKIEQDGGLFAESVQSLDAAAATIASSDADDAYQPSRSDAVMLHQGVLVSSLLHGDVMRAGFTADAMAEAYRRFVAGGSEVVDELEAIEIDGDVGMESMVAVIRESTTSDRVLVGAWFTAWVAFMANGQTDNAAMAIESLGWRLEGLDLDLAAAMIERTEAGSLGDDVYVLFESGLAPALREMTVDVELPSGERLALHLPMIEPKLADRGVRVVAVDAGEMFDTHPVGSVEAAAVAEFAAGMRSNLGAAFRRAASDLSEKIAVEQERLEAEALAAAEAAARAAEEAATTAAMEAASAETIEGDDGSADTPHPGDAGHHGEVGGDAGGAGTTGHGDATDSAVNDAPAAAVEDVEAEVAVEIVPQPLVGHSGPADLRAWTTLPAWQQAAILARPASGRLTLIVDSGGGFEGGRTTVEIPAGPVFLFVRSTASGNVVAYAARIVAPVEPAHDSSATEGEIDMGISEGTETAEI